MRIVEKRVREKAGLGRKPGISRGTRESSGALSRQVMFYLEVFCHPHTAGVSLAYSLERRIRNETVRAQFG